MVNNSWIHLRNRDSTLCLNNDAAMADTIKARDCGWVEQMRPFITQFSNKGDIVLDPFCGFASTLIAAELEGRRSVGVELDSNRVNICLLYTSPSPRDRG